MDGQVVGDRHGNERLLLLLLLFYRLTNRAASNTAGGYRRRLGYQLLLFVWVISCINPWDTIGSLVEAITGKPR